MVFLMQSVLRALALPSYCKHTHFSAATSWSCHVDSNVSDVTDLITLPRLRIEGPWFDSPYIELTETYIQSSSGWLSMIKYRGKGYFSGKSHTFKTDHTPPIVWIGFPRTTRAVSRASGTPRVKTRGLVRYLRM